MFDKKEGGGDYPSACRIKKKIEAKVAVKMWAGGLLWS